MILTRSVPAWSRVLYATCKHALLALMLLILVIPPSLSQAQASPALWECVHNFFHGGKGHSIGDIAVGVAWYGAISSGNNTCDPGVVFNVEYPKYSGVEYLNGGLQIGGVQGADTLVSHGTAIFRQFEIFPTCDFEERASTGLHTYECLRSVISDSNLSDYDVIVGLADTLVDPAYQRSDPYDGRPHKPLGLVIKFSSYGWASGSGAQFVIKEYEITNLGIPGDLQYEAEHRRLKDVFVGVRGFARAGYNLDPQFSWFDNLTEFVRSAPSPLLGGATEEFNLVLPYDNDGDPNVLGRPGFTRFSAPDVVGLAVLAKPTPSSQTSFNWWWGNWGPVRATSEVEFPAGGLGEPLGDRSSYMMMSNGETDYPQVESAIDHTGAGWLPPTNPEVALNLADGGNPEFLVSVGPFDLPRDSTVRFAVAVVGGKGLHQDPNNFQNFYDPQHPDFYRSRLDLTDLLRNVQWAKWTYDNPGVDTDGDGYAGEWFLRGGDTMYYRGDGVPDIRAALPPPGPALTFDTRSHRVAIHWNGARTETEEDLFTQRRDFEGYRVYMSRTAREDEWAFLTQRDLFNYARFTWNAGRDRWEFQDPPYSLDSLKTLYDALCDTAYGFLFHPDSFSVPLVERALLEIHFDPVHPETIDSVYRYFAQYEANNQPDDLGLGMAADAGVDVTGVIRKLYPQALPTDTAYREDGTTYLPYYEYEYKVKDIQVAEPVFLSVTAFDHGDPGSGLDPLESGKSITAQEIWPINDASVVKSERPKPGVYPNPYRLIDDYYGNNWENRRGLEPDRERARQVTFYNVPDTCTLSIWSLDGDLVRKIKHYADPGGSEATVVRWDLITRNTQAVKTGIYIWSVESRFGTDVGKLVIIK